MDGGTIPEETSILKLRHPLEENKLTESFFTLVNQYLPSKGLRLSKGEILDATIVEASSSTKNAASTRDSGMYQAVKGNNWYFRMKAHIRVNSEAGACTQSSGNQRHCARPCPR
jgi:IS5 family transposase